MKFVVQIPRFFDCDDWEDWYESDSFEEAVRMRDILTDNYPRDKWRIVLVLEQGGGS